MATKKQSVKPKPGTKTIPSKKRARKAAKEPANQLPPPVEPDTKAETQEGQKTASGDQSSIFSTSEGPLSAESERILASIPEHIGDELPDPIENVEIEEGAGGEIAGVMQGYAFSESDVQDTLIEIFDFVGERFNSDHWKLTERQARMLAGPGTELVNAGWKKLAQYLPDILAHWCETTPGLMGFLMASGLVILPKIKTQITLSRKASQPKPRPVPAQAGPTKVPEAIDPEPPVFSGAGPVWTKK